MTDADKLPRELKVFVEEQGLQRAADAFPDVVAAAAAKVLVPLTPKPIPPLTVPALMFRPRDDKAGAR